MIKITPIDVSLKEIQISIEALMYEHFDEVSSPEMREKLCPDWEKYIVLQQLGKLIAFGAFQEEVLVGYVALLLSESLHYKGTVVAISDTIFLTKEFRNSSAGIRLMKEAEKEAAIRKAEYVCWYSKENSSLENICRKKNYRIRDIIFIKELTWE